MRPGWDWVGSGMAVAGGLGVWVREIKLKPVEGTSKLKVNGWGDRLEGRVKQFGKKRVVDDPDMEILAGYFLGSIQRVQIQK